MEDYLDALEAELGPIVITEQLCPGVCYLAAKYENEGLAREYYAVTDTPVISQAARAYGRRAAGLWLFPMEADAGGWRVVKYEVSKYLQKNGLPLEQPLLDLALFAAEFNPEYFGAYPVPYHTPAGHTTRHWVLANGIYWMETDQCEELLAACYPIWSAELSSWAERLGRHLPVDEAGGIHQSRGYIFFPAQLSSVPLYELMQTRPEWDGAVIGRAALMNAIWAELPEYAVQMNRQEQQGRGGLALQAPPGAHDLHLPRHGQGLLPFQAAAVASRHPGCGPVIPPIVQKFPLVPIYGLIFDFFCAIMTKLMCQPEWAGETSPGCAMGRDSAWKAKITKKS